MVFSKETNLQQVWDVNFLCLVFRAKSFAIVWCLQLSVKDLGTNFSWQCGLILDFKTRRGNWMAPVRKLAHW